MSWGLIFRAAWERASPGNRAAAREAAKHPDQAASLMSSGVAHTLQRVQYAAQDLQRLCAASDPVSDAGMQAPSALRKVMDDIRQGRIAPDRSEKYLRQAAAEAVDATAQSKVKAATTVQGAGSIEDSVVKAAQEKQLAMQRFCDLKCRLLEQVAAVEGERPVESVSAGEAIPPNPHSNAHSNLAAAESVRAAFCAIDSAFLDHKRADDPAVPLPPTREITPGGTQKCHPPHA